jgi:hypothetical protein
MNRVNLIIVIILTSLYFNKYNACSCVGESSLKKSIKNSDVIFNGITLNKKEFEINLNLNTKRKPYYITKVEYTFLIINKLKGVNILDTIKIITGVGGGDCGIEFMIGREYLVFAKYSNKYYQGGKIVSPFIYTDVCSRTKLSNKKEIKKIRRYCKKSKYRSINEIKNDSISNQY